MDEVFRLVMEGPPEDGRVWVVRGRATIGRDGDCLVRVEDGRGVSRQNTSLEPQADGLRVVDLKSRNGTRLDGAKVEDAVARVGSRIQVGAVTLRVERAPGGEWVGRQLGGYELLDIVGEGGMGTVFRARQMSLDRTVALKILNDRLRADRKYIERFLGEARLAAQLNHRHIIQVHDFGATQGIYYFSMEFVAGETLLDRMRRQEVMPVDEVLRILVDTADALDYAHKHQLIHRDVKPENIMISKDGEVKLADLGIAKDMRQDAVEAEASQRVVLGTPLYMAPEAALGESLDARADVYSLGASFYHLLALHPPFTGKSSTEIIRKHVGEAPVPLAKVSPHVPPALAELIDRMIEKDRQKRPNDAGEVRELAERIRESLTRSDRILAPSRRLPRRAGVLVTLAMLGAGVPAGIWLGGRLRQVMEPSPDPGPVPAPQQGEATRLLAVARDLESRGEHLQAAQACEKISRRFPGTGEAASARALGLECARALQRLREQAAMEAWVSIAGQTGAASPRDALSLVEAFLRDHPGTAAEPLARDEMARLRQVIDRLDREAAAREAGRKAHLAELDARVRAAVASGELGALRVELETCRAQFEGTAQEASWLGLCETLATARARIVADALSSARTRMGIQRFDLALAEMGEACRRLEEEAPMEFESLVGEMARTAIARADAALDAAQVLVREMDLAGASGLLQEGLAGLEGTEWGAPLERRLRIVALLEELQRDIVGRIRISPRAQQCDLTVPGRGVFRVEAADALEIRFAGGRLSWKDLPVEERHRLYLHYLDERRTRTHILLYAHAIEFGLDANAAAERATAGDDELRRAGLIE